MNRLRIRRVVAVSIVAMVLGVGSAALASPAGAATYDPNQPVSRSGPALRSPNGWTATPWGSAAGTGRQPTSAIPVPAPQVPQPESLIGPDNRVQVGNATVSPYRKLTLLQVQFPGSSGYALCSGAIVGRRLIATAGHCVYNPFTRQWATGVRAYFGVANGVAQYGVCNGVKTYTTAGWLNDGLDTHDYGAVRIDCQAGYELGVFGMSLTSARGDTVQVMGYPGDPRDKPPGTLWRSSGTVAAAGRRLYYDNDTTAGMSGSPVVLQANGTMRIVAIHAYAVYGTSGLNAQYNHGTRVTQTVLNNYATWRADS